MKTWHNASGSGRKKDTTWYNLDSFSYVRKAAVENGYAHYIPDIIRDELGILLQQFRWTTI